MTQAQDIKNYFASLQVARPVISGTVATVVYDNVNARQRYANVNVAGQVMRIALADNAPILSGGDIVKLEQWGSSSQADYQVLNAYGARPAAGYTQFMDVATIAGQQYEGGDVILGGYGETSPNWWFDYSDGVFYRRIGARVMGYDRADGISVWGPPDGVHWKIDPVTNKFSLNNGDTELRYFDGDTGYIVGWDGVGKPLGPGIRWGVIKEVDTNGDPVLGANGQQLERYTWRVVGANGVPAVSALSGNQDDPNDVRFMIGNESADSSLVWQDGLIVRGEIQATSGTIEGILAIEAGGAITWAGGKGTLDSAGIRYIENADNYWELNPSSTWFSYITSDNTHQDTLVVQHFGPTGISTAISGFSGVSSAGTGVRGYGRMVGVRGDTVLAGTGGIGVEGESRDILNGVGVRAVALAAGTNCFALQIADAPVDGGSQRYTNLADATAATDALNRQTGDGRYLLQTGATTGATAQAQTFTNGIVGPSWKPTSNSTTALQLQNAAGSALVTVDTSNGRLGIGTSPSYNLHVSGNIYATSTAGIGTTPDAALQLNVAKIGSAAASNQTGVYVYAYATTNGSHPVYGSRGLGYAAGADAQTGGVFGGDFLAINNGAGAVSYLAGLTATAYNAAAGNVAQVTVLNISATQCYSTGTIGTAYGLFIGTQKNTGITTGYGIYQQGTADLNAFFGPTVFNESGADADFRIEGDTEANMLLVDASADTLKIGGSTAGACLAVSKGGGLALPTATKAVADSPYSVGVGDYTIRCNAVDGAITVALPEATGSGRILNIKKVDASANAVTVDGYSTNTIDGETTQTITSQYDNMQLQDAAAGVWDIL